LNKTTIFISIVLLASQLVFSQNALTNYGASIKVFGSGVPSANQELLIDGNFENQNDGSNDGAIDLDNFGNITLTGNWVNNSFNNVFEANSNSLTDGTVTMINNNFNQIIGGLSPTYFENLLVKGNPKVLTNNNNSVNNMLIIDGVLELNNRTFEVKNNSTNAITYLSGFIKSEGLPGNYGVIKWNTGNTAGVFSIPFGSDNYIGDNDLQLSINLESSMNDTDYFRFATYHTDPLNQPLPTSSTPLETEVRKVVDRFWILAPNNVNVPIMDISFSFASADITDATNSINPDKLVASRNNTNIGKWLDMYPRGSQTLNTIEIEDVSPSDFFPNWTLLNMPPVLTNLFTPDAFSPNGDGVNDLFAPVFQVDFQVIEYELIIYNRWGSIVFNTNDQGEGWNGVSKNSNHPPQVGVYSWIIFVKGYSDNDFSGDGIKEKFTGMVTLIM